VLELNVMLPVMARNLLESVALLSASTTLLASRCVAGSPRTGAVRGADRAEPGDGDTARVRIGYDKPRNLPTRRTTGEDDPHAAFGKGVLTTDEIDRILDPRR